MFLVQNINVSQLPHGMAVTDLCFVKPHSAYFIQNWECYRAIWNFGGRSARSGIVNVCPTIRQEINNEHEIIFTIIVQNWQKTKTKKSKTKISSLFPAQ